MRRVRNGLGRRAAHGLGNDRDAEHAMSKHLRRGAAEVVRRKGPWRLTSVLDQGDTATCVGQACKYVLMAAPFMDGLEAAPSAFEIYDAAIAIDEWSDNDGDSQRQMGTSVRAGMKVLQGLGFVEEYVWAQRMEEAIEWLRTRGPVTFGIPFYDSMFEVDEKGFMVCDFGSGLAGGHAMTAVFYSEGREAFRLCNSWGREWGEQGRCWLRVKDAEELVFGQEGEIAAMVQVK